MNFYNNKRYNFYKLVTQRTFFWQPLRKSILSVI